MSASEPDQIVWLRDLDGTGSMHVCTPHCPGAVEYVRAHEDRLCPGCGQHLPSYCARCAKDWQS